MATDSSHIRANRSTSDDLDKREHDLSELLNELIEAKNELTDIQIIKVMKDKGYSNYDRNCIYRDRRSLSQHNTFIRDLTEANASRFYESIWISLDNLHKDALESYAKLKDGREKRAAGYYIMNLAEKKDNMMKGPMMNISMALGMSKMQNLEKENEALKNMLLKNSVDPESGEKMKLDKIAGKKPVYSYKDEEKESKTGKWVV